jgi:hypothetical protein
VKVSGSRRRKCAAYSHAYLSGEIRVGDMTYPEGVCTPIMVLPMVFQGEEGGTSVAYGLGLGRESLSGSPSSKMICKRSDCARLLGRGGDDGGARFGDVSRKEGDDEASARIFTRVGACADELRLMGATRVVYVSARANGGGGCGSVDKKVSRAREPPWMDRIWLGPCGDGANWTKHRVVGGG